MIYMHYFMRAYPQLLEVCTSLLPADVASQSNISGCNIQSGAAIRNKSNGGRFGPGNGSKKNKVGLDIAIAALDSIASKNSAKEQNILMETERVLCSDINDENTKSADY
jgi:arginine utilization protein RocB